MGARATDRPLLLAHARGRITELGLKIRAGMDPPIAIDSLALLIAAANHQAPFRSMFVPWDLADDDVEAVIKRVAADLGDDRSCLTATA
jgi:hypothetical protein